MTKLKKIIRKLGLVKLARFLYWQIILFLNKYKWKKIKKLNHICLELGSGPKKGIDGWITVDLKGADISHDLRQGIPLPDSSVSRIYTSHLFEHIPYQDLVSFIEECFRALKHGGELSVCVPNASNYINAYYEKRLFKERDKSYAPALVETGSYMDQVNYIAYMKGEHHYLFDEENLVNTIKKSKFKSVKLREFDPKLDSLSRDYESIYAIAIK